MNIKFLDYLELDNDSPQQSIDFFDGQLYLINDKADPILVMNKNWENQDAINLIPDVERAPGNLTSGVEATSIIEIDKVPFLFVMGSGSAEASRKKGMLLNLVTRDVEEFDLAVFYNRLRDETGLVELNIGDATVMGDKLILSNYGNKNKPDNHLIITATDFWKKQTSAEITLVKMEWDQKPANMASLSGLTYSYKNDWLVLSVSTCEGNTNIGEGSTGDSYLVVIEDALRKTGRKKIKLNDALNLSQTDDLFKKKKIKSICIQSEKDKKLKLHLVAETATGNSCLFKIRIKE